MSDDFGKAVSAGYAALADGSWAKPQEWHLCKHGHRHARANEVWYCDQYSYAGGVIDRGFAPAKFEWSS